MAYIFKSAANPRYGSAANTFIDLDVTFTNGETHPFTAMRRDTDPQGHQIYLDAVAGKFGPIAPYVAPPPNYPALAAQAEVVAREVALKCFMAGIPFPPEWQAHHLALRAIIDGTNANPTAIPTQPAMPSGI